MPEQTETAAAAPSGGTTRFEVRDGTRRVPCTVSDEALATVAGLTAPVPAALRNRSFDRFRSQIDAAAKLKLEGCPPGFAGPLVVSSDDLRRVPREAGVPWFGRVTA